jgi:Holliday junction resolvase
MSKTILEVLQEGAKSWNPPEKSPTANGRWVGSFMEESLKDHLKTTIPTYISKFGGPTEYPDITLKDNGSLYAFEVKATEKDEHVNNRTKSPESIVKNYAKFKEHYVIAILYRLNHETKVFSDIEIKYIELWKYTSTSFKDYSALAALGSIDYMLRTRQTDNAFRSEKEFIEFANYMSQHPGPIIERNRLAKEWLRKYRGSF